MEVITALKAVLHALGTVKLDSFENWEKMVDCGKTLSAVIQILEAKPAETAPESPAEKQEEAPKVEQESAHEQPCEGKDCEA